MHILLKTEKHFFIFLAFFFVFVLIQFIIYIQIHGKAHSLRPYNRFSFLFTIILFVFSVETWTCVSYREILIFNLLFIIW